MDEEEACRIADAAVFAKTEQHLKDLEKFILQESWRGQKYEQIAKTLSYAPSYIRKQAGPELWTLLSKALGEKVSKTNFREALERWARRHSVQAHPTYEQRSNHAPIWSAIPDVPVFFGREEELGTLETAIVRDRCRVVLLSGLAGIGKTALAAKVAHQVRSQFECTLWRSLSTTPSLQTLLTDLTAAFGIGIENIANDVTNADQISRLISCLIDCLQQRRSLLILDDVEAVLRSAEMVGQYGDGYQEYGTVFRRLATESHSSCLMLIGREQPTELLTEASETALVRRQKLRGLPLADAKSLLADRGVSSLQSGVEDLIQLYRGNPLALKIVATTIRDLFGGDVSQFLRQDTVLTNDIFQDLLHAQFIRLSELERSCIYDLVLANEPVSLAQVRENLRFLDLSRSEVMKALLSLNQRSLIEEFQGENRSSAAFTVQPVIKRYVIRQLIEQVEHDMTSVIETLDLRKLGVLKSHELIRNEPLQSMALTQNLLMSAIARLHMTITSETSLEDRLRDLLIMLESKALPIVGHSRTNILGLLAMIGGENQ